MVEDKDLSGSPPIQGEVIPPSDVNKADLDLSNSRSTFKDREAFRQAKPIVGFTSIVVSLIFLMLGAYFLCVTFHNLTSFNKASIDLLTEERHYQTCKVEENCKVYQLAVEVEESSNSNNKQPLPKEVKYKALSLVESSNYSILYIISITLAIGFALFIMVARTVLMHNYTNNDENISNNDSAILTSIKTVIDLIKSAFSSK
ncbi:hypothetical protein N9R79_03850 [Vibrio sp.]|nr:hypothetical protein [Vibrio sp.]